MTVEAREPTLDAVRANTDAPCASVHGHDISASINAQYERITDDAAPGAGSRTYRGHTHDQQDSRGIARGCIGQFYAYNLPLTHTTTATGSGESMGNGATSHYEASGADYILGVAYVSPGVESIKCEVCMKADSVTGTPQFRIKNITDTAYSGQDTNAWETLTASPKWYTFTVDADEAIAVSSPGGGAYYRVTLDIHVKTDGTSRTISFYGGFPYEYTDEP